MKAVTWMAAVALLVLSCSSSSLKTDGGGGGHDAATGTAGQGGTAGASPDGQSCQQDAVEFRLQASDGAAWYVFDSAQGCAPVGWLSLRDLAGNEIAIGNPTEHCCTLAECADCSFQHVVCQTGWTTPALPVSRSWDATLFPPGHCGTSQTACVMDRACAPAGQYVAHMCARHAPDLQEQVTCVDVPFDLPAAGPVVGTLPQS